LDTNATKSIQNPHILIKRLTIKATPPNNRPMKRLSFSCYAFILILFFGCTSKNVNKINPELDAGGFLAVPVHINTTERTDRHFSLGGIYSSNGGTQLGKFSLLLYPPNYSGHFTFSPRLPPGKYQIQHYNFYGDEQITTTLQDSEKDLLSGGSFSFIIKDGEVSMLSKILQIGVVNLNEKELISWRWTDSLAYGYDIECYRKMLDIETGTDYWTYQLGKGSNVAMKETPHEISNHSGLVAYSNNTAVDTSNNLMWATYDNGFDIDWYTANKYCENYKLGGFNDWRMPSDKELSSLFARGIKYEGDHYDFIKITDRFTWTSKRLGDVGAQLFNQETGKTIIFHPGNRKRNRVLPVRDITP